MAYEQRDNSGALFKNTRREKETHPNLNGHCLIDGVAYFVDAWTKEGEKGKWISLSFKRKGQPAPETPPRDDRTHGQRKRAAVDDDVPF